MIVWKKGGTSAVKVLAHGGHQTTTPWRTHLGFGAQLLPLPFRPGRSSLHGLASLHSSSSGQSDRTAAAAATSVGVRQRLGVLRVQQPSPATTRWLASSSSTSSSESSASSSESSSPDPRIQARPPGNDVDDDVDAESTKFPFPNQDQERHLAQLQNHVLDLYNAGHYKKAQQAALDVLEQTNKYYKGAAHPAVASSHHNVGLCYKVLGDFIPSRKHYQQACQMYRQTVGADHASHASSLHNLGQLNRTQIHLDETLSTKERLDLLQQAVGYLQQAHDIRLDECGPTHPHTVASKSAWGSALAAQLLHQYQKQQKQQPNNGTTTVTITTTTAQTTTSSTTTSSTTSSSTATTTTLAEWNVAHDHLRQALETAIQHPRGRSTATAEQKQQSSKQRGTSGTSSRRGGGARNNNNNTNNNNAMTIQTLSAASAAQNLSIFLKARGVTDPTATTTTTTNHHNTNDTTDNTTNNHNTNEPTTLQTIWFSEAKQLYQQVLQVRMKLLSVDHPDVYATKHSLAELQDAMGELDAAAKLRQEMMDTFGPVVDTIVDTTINDDKDDDK